MRNKDNDTGQVKAQQSKNLLGSNEKYIHVKERQERKKDKTYFLYLLLFLYSSALSPLCGAAHICMCLPPQTPLKAHWHDNIAGTLRSVLYQFLRHPSVLSN